MMEAFQTYSLFLALTGHFRGKYDYFKYHGKMRLTKEAFEARSDRLLFQKLSRKVPDIEMEDFLVANLVAGRGWVGDFLNDDALETYKEYKIRKDNLCESVVQEIQSIKSELPNSKALFTSEENEYAPIIIKTLDGSLHHETVIVLNHFVGFAQKFDERHGIDDMVWGKIRSTCQRLKPFVVFDKEKMKEELSLVLLRSP